MPFAYWCWEFSNMAKASETYGGAVVTAPSCNLWGK